MDSNQNSVSPRPSLAEELLEWLRNFPAEFAVCWRQLPNKFFFFTLLGAWVALFHFYGNATFGYISDSASLPYWMWFTYTNPMGNGEDGHGVYVPFVVLGLFWWKRKTLLSVPIRLWWPALFLLAAALMMHLLGYMVQQPRISIVALFMGIYALMGLAWGWAWMRASFFPFFLFVFCIPITSIGEPVTVPLRLMVSRIVEGFCNNVLGLNIIREGNLLFNSAHTYSYEVAAACSGLQSLIAIFALATVIAFLFLKKGWKRSVMIASALPLAIIANVVRLMDIIIAAELYGQNGGNFVHNNEYLNAVPYVPAILGLILLGRWLQEPEVEPSISLDAKPA